MHRTTEEGLDSLKHVRTWGMRAFLGFVAKKFQSAMHYLSSFAKVLRRVNDLGACRLTLHIFPQVRYERPA